MNRSQSTRIGLPVKDKPAADCGRRISSKDAEVKVGGQTSSNFNSPSFSRLQASLSPGLSQTCLSLGWPDITPSGVPVKMMSPGLSVIYREMKLIIFRLLKMKSLVLEDCLVSPLTRHSIFRLSGSI